MEATRIGRNGLNRLREAMTDCEVFSNSVWHVNCVPLLLLESAVVFGIGLLMPYLVTEQGAGVLNLINSSLRDRDVGQLLEAAVKLTFLNGLRSMPNYFCIFVFSNAFIIHYRGKRHLAIEAASFSIVALAVIRLVYSLILYMHRIQYGLGMHSALIIGFVVYLRSLEFGASKQRVGPIAMGLYTLGIQYLDVIPALTAIGLGKGELSTYIKNAAILLNAQRVLTMVAAPACIVCVFNSLALLRLAVNEYNLRAEMSRKESLEKQLSVATMQAVEMRAFREIQSLVHDLKAPLTTVQGLVGLTQLVSEDERVLEYQSRICSSVDKMSNMISEILYEDRRTVVTTEALFHTVLASIQGVSDTVQLEYRNVCKSSLVKVNQVRMTRAIVNIVHNSVAAVDQNGRIEIDVSLHGDWISIKVQDNGRGISAESLSRIWEVGYSQNRSTGLGLGFVRSVVESHGGTIQIESSEGDYTCVTILLRRHRRWKRSMFS